MGVGGEEGGGDLRTDSCRDSSTNTNAKVHCGSS